MKHLWPVLLAAALLPASAYAQTGCQRDSIAQAMLRNDLGFLSTPVSINGKTVSMIVDTGSDGSLISRDASAMLDLSPDLHHRTVLNGTGGAGRVVPNMLAGSVKIGGQEFGPLSLPLGELPGKPMISPPVEGLIGGEILSRFDLVIDSAKQQLSFEAPLACDHPPGWTGLWHEVDPQRDGNRLMLPVTLDGVRLTALLDSGARSRILSTSAAARLGVDSDRLASDPGGITSGVDGRPQSYHWHRFHKLEIGGESEDKPTLTVAPLPEDIDLLLGSDWFAAHRIWISYSTGRMFFVFSGK